jgi:hypothetical protein
MNVPWRVQPKTWRDQLYDLGFGVSEILATPSEITIGSNTEDSMRDRIVGLQQIEAGLSNWKSSWLATEYRHLRVKCDCQSGDILSCICSVPATEFPNYDFTLLQVECWALQLLISTKLSSLLSSRDEFTRTWSPDLSVRSAQIAAHLDAALSVPVFQRSAELSSAVTEGTCRMVFPNWILKDYRSSANMIG